MKDTLGLIPQVFYDLIGRIVPGATIVVLGFALLVDDAYVGTVFATVAGLSGPAITVTFVAGLLAAYVVGLMLGAIGTLLEEGLRQPAFTDVEKVPPSETVDEKDVPYIYDFILLKNPSAGARLAKLRAESHMCGAFVVGFCVLMVAYIGINVTARQMLVLAALAASALAATVLQRHLRTRGWRLQINCWLILRDSGRPVDSDGSAAVDARIPVKPESLSAAADPHEGAAS